MRYLATTSREDFAGKLCGVQFKAGKAVVDEYTIDETLGRDVEETVRMMTHDFGLTVKRIAKDIVVEELDGEVEAPPPPPAAKVGKKGGRRKASPAVAYGPQEGV